jgi:citrate synthase
VALAETHSFESVADLLWESPPTTEADWRPVDLPDPPRLGPSELLSWAVLLTGAQDQLRSDLRPDAVYRNARKVIATAVANLPKPAAHVTNSGSIAKRLARHFVTEPGPALERAIETALVLLADHELATSTLAVRVAASTRADVYDSLLAGLSTLAGPLHGGASETAHALLVHAERNGVGAALDQTLRWQGSVPGFGHVLYRSVDPRFEALVARLDDLASPSQLGLLHSLVEVAAAHAIPPPNVDLALAALTWTAGLDADAGRTIFSVARLAGWTAHYLEELGERPLRFRARAVYSTNR